MTNEQQYKLGLIGLGTMGRNLLLNMADSGFAVAGYDKNTAQVDALQEEAKQYNILGAKTVKTFVESLEKPRSILLLVPAGRVVDLVIEDLLPLLDPGDLIIDGGNSHFPDTARRQQELKEKNIQFLGLGISGGAEGARLGPSMMPGGERTAYERVQDILEAVAAKVDGEPCITFLGKGASGHYVKMVHNGIEYGLMELLAEVYDLMKRALGLSNERIGQLFAEWNGGELQSYLVEITAKIFDQKDELTGQDLIDVIMDASRSKGTGKWTSQDAMNLQAPVPVIDLAVIMRDMSKYKEEREAAAPILATPPPIGATTDTEAAVQDLRDALYFAFIATYAQGMYQLQRASEEYDYDLDLEAVARIWRGGCIIRAALLEKFRTAYDQQPNLDNLMIAPGLSTELLQRHEAIKRVINMAMDHGIPVAGLMGALMYFDSYRSGRLPANLIQAQRDFFGSHTYERLDREGKFHTEWGGES